MNRLRILLMTSALLTGGSALAQAQEHYQTGFSVQVRVGGHDGDNRGGFFYAQGDGDHDRDDRYNRYFDRDHGRDRDDRGRWKRDDDRRGRDFDHDGDRR